MHVSESTKTNSVLILKISWNTDNCVDINVDANKTGLEAASRTNGTTATEEFFTNKMLELSPGIGQVIQS